MDLDRISALLGPFSREADTRSKAARPLPGGLLSGDQLQSILTYINILLRWNAKTNLTAIRDPEEIVTRHFGESLFAARHLFPREPQQTASNGSLASLGTSRALPGAPFKPGFGLSGDFSRKLLPMNSRRLSRPPASSGSSFLSKFPLTIYEQKAITGRCYIQRWPIPVGSHLSSLESKTEAVNPCGSIFCRPKIR